MPVYEYRCEKCKKEFEATHSITTKLEECPTCKEAGEEPVAPTRLISGGTGFILSGGGWGSTGYS